MSEKNKAVRVNEDDSPNVEAKMITPRFDLLNKTVSDHPRTRILPLEWEIENNAQNHTAEELNELKTELSLCKAITAIFDSFDSVPSNAESITEPWFGFPAGTRISDIYDWLERTLQIEAIERFILY